MDNAVDRNAYETLVQKLKTPPFDPAAPVVPKPTSYDAVRGLGDEIHDEAEAEKPEARALAPKLWDAAG